MAAAIVAGLIALISLVGTVLVGASEGFGDGSIGGLLGALIFGALAWKLWAGVRYAWFFGIALGALLALAGLLNPTPLSAAIIAVTLGAGFIALLTLPANARAYFRGERRPHPTLG